MVSAAAGSDSSKLVMWSLIAAVVTFVLFIALAVGSIIIQPTQGGGYGIHFEEAEVEGAGGGLYVP